MGEKLKCKINIIQDGVEILDMEKKSTLEIFKDGAWKFETPELPYGTNGGNDILLVIKKALMRTE